jgi:hypothetical protein
MTTIIEYLNFNNEPMVKVLADDGSCICYTAERYKEVLQFQEAISDFPVTPPTYEQTQEGEE